jgi:hypothetical protein
MDLVINFTGDYNNGFFMKKIKDAFVLYYQIIIAPVYLIVYFFYSVMHFLDLTRY